MSLKIILCNYFPVLLCIGLLFLVGPTSLHAKELKSLFDADGVVDPLFDCAPLSSFKGALSTDYNDYEGKIIADIRHKSIDVFDGDNPKENNRFYQFFNRLHINTSFGVIRSQLLFDIGDMLDTKKLSESERILRSRKYLSDAYIVVDQVCGDSVALLVVARDVWTTEPELNLGREGGENQYGFGFKEGNIAGTGAIFQVGYYKDSDRSSVDYGFYSPHIFNSHLEMALTYSEASDGQNIGFSLKRPFYSIQAPWAAGLSFGDTAVVESVRYADQEINRYKHQKEYWELYTGVAVRSNDKRAQRLSVGLSYDEHVFSSLSPSSAILPRSYDYTYPWLEYRFLENHFAVYKNLNLLHQTEDVSLGADVRFRLGYTGHLMGNVDDAFLYDFKYSDLLGLGPQHLVKMYAYVNGQYHVSDHSLSESVWGGRIGYHYLLQKNHRLYSSLSYFQGHQLPQHKELTAGGVTGLRGYPLDYQRGDRKYVFTIEKRYISDWHIFNLVRLGVVTYMDIGKAWGSDYPYAHDLVDVGFGLRLSSSKARVGSVLHIDLAVPLVDKNQVDSFQLILKGSRGL